MERPINIVEQGIYIEPNIFNNDSEYELFHSYLESQKYIEWLETELKKLRVADVIKNEVAVCDNEWHESNMQHFGECHACGLKAEY